MPRVSWHGIYGKLRPSRRLVLVRFGYDCKSVLLVISTQWALHLSHSNILPKYEMAITLAIWNVSSGSFRRVGHPTAEIKITTSSFISRMVTAVSRNVSRPALSSDMLHIRQATFLTTIFKYFFTSNLMAERFPEQSQTSHIIINQRNQHATVLTLEHSIVYIVQLV